MQSAIIYIHGKGGTADEAAHYQSIFKHAEVIGFDYQAHNPWEAKAEFPQFFDAVRAKYKTVSVIANSIGAFFTMHALQDKQIAKAAFISPIVNMETLITDMMAWAKVTENVLCARKEIETDFGETLSWEYLCYVREHPIQWHIATQILYGEKDALTSYETMAKFAAETGAPLTVMKNGEHWFHTNEQMTFLDSWIQQTI